MGRPRGSCNITVFSKSSTVFLQRTMTFLDLFHSYWTQSISHGSKMSSTYSRDYIQCQSMPLRCSLHTVFSSPESNRVSCIAFGGDDASFPSCRGQLLNLSVGVRILILLKSPSQWCRFSLTLDFSEVSWDGVNLGRSVSLLRIMDCLEAQLKP